LKTDNNFFSKKTANMNIKNFTVYKAL